MSADAGVKRIMDLTNGVGAGSVLERVGTPKSMMQAIHRARASEAARSPMSASRIDFAGVAEHTETLGALVHCPVKATQ